MKKRSNLSRLTSYAGGRRNTYVSFVGAVGRERAYRPCSVLVYMANHSRRTRSVARFLESGEYRGLRLVGGAVRGNIHRRVHSGADVFASERVSDSLEYQEDAYAAYRRAPPGHNRKIRERKAQKDCERFELRRRKLSGAQAARQSRSDRNADRAAVLTARVRLAARLLSLIPVALGFMIMTKMTGADMERKMKEYQNSLSDMSTRR